MNKKTILYVVEDTKSAQFEYQVKNVVEATKKSQKWEAKWVLKNDLLEGDLDGISLVVILRQTAKDNTVLNFIKLAHGKGIKVLFALDDLVFDYLDLAVLMRATGSKNIFYWASYVWGVRRIARRVDGFIATNEFLGNLLTRSFNKPFAVIPNSLNKAQLEVAEEILPKKPHDGFIIGYFSGSPTHRKDLALVEGEIIKFLKAHEDAKFLMVGYMDLSPEMRKLQKKGKVKTLEVLEHTEMLKMMAEVDVNIAPLMINDFTNSKSELKFFEAGVVETVTIASPTYAFSKVISDGENGLLAEPGKWVEKLEFLYENPKKREEMAKNARKYALKNYYGAEFLKRVEAAYEIFV